MGKKSKSRSKQFQQQQPQVAGNNRRGMPPHRHSYMRTGVWDAGLVQRFPEVDFSTPASREPLPFQITVKMSDEALEMQGAPQERFYKNEIFSPRGMYDKMVVEGDEGFCHKVCYRDIMELVRDDLNELGTWKCIVCGEHTRNFVHSSRFITSSNQKPRFEDVLCRPVCRESDCSRRIMEDAQKIGKGLRKTLKKKFPDKAKKLLPKPDNLKFCGNCFELANRNLVCGNCLLVAYCSKECQVQHWKGQGYDIQAPHKIECKGKKDARKPAAAQP